MYMVACVRKTFICKSHKNFILPLYKQSNRIDLKVPLTLKYTVRNETIEI